MGARTADPTTFIPPLPTAIARSEIFAEPDPGPPLPEHPLGMFRGLAYALLFQFLLGFVSYAGWELLRHLL